MKKFYTALAAVTICASTCLGEETAIFSIDNPINLKAKTSHSLTISSDNLMRAKAMEQAPVARRASSKAAAKPATAADIDGIYCLYMYGKAGNQQTSYQNAGPVQIKATTGNNIEMGPFIFKNATFAGTFDPESQTITIAKGQSVAVDGTTNMTMYEYRWSDKLDHDVVFNIDVENRLIQYEAPVDADDYYDAVVCLGTAGSPVATGVFAQMYVLDINFTNAIMAAAEFNSETNQLTDPYYDYLWIENQDGKIAVTGFYGLGFDDTFFLTVDATAKTATATDQVVLTSGSGANATAYYLWGFDSEGYADKKEVVFQGIEQDGAVVLYAPAVGILNSNATDGMVIYEVQFLMPYNPFTAGGLDNVSVSNDADAPAEFFNLQGVRVANPQAGQLVIKRQGATVTKMIAR